MLETMTFPSPQIGKIIVELARRYKNAPSIRTGRLNQVIKSDG